MSYKLGLLMVSMGVMLACTIGVASAGASSSKATFCKAAESVPVTQDISTGNVPTSKTSVNGVVADITVAKSIESELRTMVSTAPSTKIKGVLEKAAGASSHLVEALGLVLVGDEELARGVYPKGGNKADAEVRVKIGLSGSSGEISTLISIMGGEGNTLAKVCPALRVYQQ